MRILRSWQSADYVAISVGGIAEHRMTPPCRHARPAIVLATLAVSRLVDDLLPVVLTDIGDEQVAGRRIEGKLIRVAHAVSPNLRQRTGLDRSFLGDAEEDHQSLVRGRSIGIVSRDLVGNVFVLNVDVDPKHFGERGRKVLTGLVRVTFPATITGADVKVTVRDLAAIVVVPGLLDAHQDLGSFVGALGRHHIRACAIDLEADDHTVAVER